MVGLAPCLVQSFNPAGSSARGNSTSAWPNFVVAQEKSFVQISLLILKCWHPVHNYLGHCEGHMKHGEWHLELTGCSPVAPELRQNPYEDTRSAAQQGTHKPFSVNGTST